MMLHSHITAAATGRGYSRRPGGHAHRAAGVASQPPSAFVKGPMTAPAHEDEVAEARLAALDPVLEVMGISPPGRAPAAWELAVAISQHQRLAQRRRDHPGRPAHAQNLRAGTHLDAGHRGVARNAARRLTRDRLAALHLSRWGSRLRVQRGHLRD